MHHRVGVAAMGVEYGDHADQSQSSIHGAVPRFISLPRPFSMGTRFRCRRGILPGDVRRIRVVGGAEIDTDSRELPTVREFSPVRPLSKMSHTSVVDM